ncbi:hypothetical protein Scep_017805 [Stephania cephalantha]|uniref:Uncharacterized protein n=1 Tax=Stephania cephalantha TaxID=152367 RepID=A0AAP0IQ78_9MAGN
MAERGEPPRRRGRRDDVDGGCGRVRRDVAAVDQPEASTNVDGASGSSEDEQERRTSSADGGSRATRRPRTAVPATRRWRDCGDDDERRCNSGQRRTRRWRDCEGRRRAAARSTTPARTRTPARGSDAGKEEERWISSGSGAVNGVEQRRGGALPDRSIPDETQQQWTTRHDFDEALFRDGLLAKKTRGVGHGTYEAIVGCRVRISRSERDVLRTICDFSRPTIQQGEGSTARRYHLRIPE